MMSNQWNTEVARQQIAVRKAREADHHSKNVMSATVEGFLTTLKHRFGNIPRAWHAMDRDGNDRLSKNEFFQACRDVSYNGNMKKLWEDLDSDGSGFIGLEELCPVESKMLQDM